jgi:hypothetical protein
MALIKHPAASMVIKISMCHILRFLSSYYLPNKCSDFTSLLIWSLIAVCNNARCISLNLSYANSDCFPVVTTLSRYVFTKMC